MIYVGKEPQLALLDSGSEVNLISANLFDKIKERFVMNRIKSTNLISVDGTPIKTYGTYNIKSCIYINNLDPFDADITVVDHPTENLLFGLPMLNAMKVNMDFKANEKTEITIIGTINGTIAKTNGELLTKKDQLYTSTSHRRIFPNSTINMNIKASNNKEPKQLTVINKSENPVFIKKQTPILIQEHEQKQYCTCRNNSLPEDEKQIINNSEILNMVKTGKFFSNNYQRNGIGAKDRLTKVLLDNIDTAAKFRFDMGRVNKEIFLHDVNIKPSMPDEKRFQPFKTNQREREALSQVIKNMEKYGVLTRNKPSPYSNPAFMIAKADTPSFFSHGESNYCKKCVVKQ